MYTTAQELHATSVVDQRTGQITPITSPLMEEDGFIWWNGEKREIADIHHLSKGSQVELAH